MLKSLPLGGAARVALFAGVGLSALAFTAPASAQDTAATAAGQPCLDADGDGVCDPVVNADGSPAETGSIVVTGSRIARPNLASTTPIATVTAQDLTERGTPNIGDALSELPSLGSSFTQANSTRFIGTAGINTLDLRDLGSARTLVLVNGRRHVTSQPGTYDVDTNTIPSELLQSVDIVTGGNSAVYGSDAIAGVVNFVLRRDFEGLRLRGQGGVSDEGDAASYFASVTAGKNLFDNRLNIAFAAEYDRNDQLLARQRDYFTGAASGFFGFTTTEPTTTYNPVTRLTTTVPNRNNNGIPNTTLVSGLRFPQLNADGMVQTTCQYLPTATYDAFSPAARAAFDRSLRASCASVTTDPQGRLIPNSFTPTGGGVNHFYSFTNDGRLIRSVPTGDLRPVGGGVIGGLGSTGLEEAQLRPELERYAFNILLNADISSAFRPFAEAKYVRIDSLQQSTQPTFATGTLRSSFSIDNPFLTPAQRAQLVEVLGVNTTRCRARQGAPASGGCPAGQEPNPAFGTPVTTFNSFRFNYDLGTRSEDHRRETYRAVVGVGGDFSTTGNLRYEIALNYGRTETFYDTGGNINVARYNNATDAARDANGNIVCRINLNPATADPNCAPLNPFGFGSLSQAAKDYVLAISSREQWAEQINATAFISGDTGGFFNLPGGPVGFVLGGEYRREDAFSAFDEFTVSGQSFLNAIGAFDPPAQTVKEAFAEIRVPLLADRPFFNELTLEGAARVSDYNTQADPVWAYNAGLVYSPVADLRIRGSYARAVRAPNIGNLYSTQSQTFLNGLVDPCNQTVINENPNRARNCAAAGIPTTIVVAGETRPWTNTAASGISGFNQGNPNLNPETSDSYTLGAVFTPRFLPGFSFSADYYDITVNNVISGVAPQAIINRCYDDPVGLDNPFCAVVFRRTTNDPLTNFTFAGQQNRTFAGVPQIDIPIIGPSFINQPFNYAKLKSRGIDMELAYVGQISDGVRLNARLLVTRNLEREDFTFVTDPERSTRLHGTLGLPEWAASLFTNIDFGELDIGYNARFLSRMTVGSWETQFSHQGRPPENPDAFPFTHYPDILYHNLRVGFEPEGGQFRFYIGMDNVLDQLPPSPLDGRGAGSGIYPITGRYMYAGIRFNL